MTRYRHYYKYSDYYDDYGEENPVAILILLSLLYMVYKYFTDKSTFFRWLIYGLIILVILLIFFVFIKIYKGKKAKKIFTEIKRINEDIDNLVVEIKKDDEIVEKNNVPTLQAQALHNALLARGIKCELEKWDGYKHIDIAIPWARMNIEIDGIQHYLDAKQITSDYQRNYFSIKKGFKTLRFPNFVIEKYLDSVADAVAKIARDEYYKRRVSFK